VGTRGNPVKVLAWRTQSQKARGFTVGLLGKLIRAGLATATPGIVKAGGGRTLGVVRLAITEKGRTMIAR
jgi:hypothetical protein